MDINELKNKIKDELQNSSDMQSCMGIDIDWSEGILKKLEDEMASEIASSIAIGKPVTYIDIRKLACQYIDECHNIEELLWFFYLLGCQKSTVDAISVMQPVYSYCRDFIKKVESKAKDLQGYFFEGMYQ